MSEKSKLAQLAQELERIELDLPLSQPDCLIGIVKGLRTLDREFDLVRKSDHLDGGLEKLLAEIEGEGSWKGMVLKIRAAMNSHVLVPREEYEKSCSVWTTIAENTKLKQDLAASRAETIKLTEIIRSDSTAIRELHAEVALYERLEKADWSTVEGAKECDEIKRKIERLKNSLSKQGKKEG